MQFRILTICIFIVIDFLCNSLFADDTDITRSFPQEKKVVEEVPETVMFNELQSTLGSFQKKDNKAYGKVDFKADNIEYDSKNGTLIAKGNVEFFLNPEYLRADQVFYNSKNRYIMARGNVYYKNQVGDIIQADSLDLDSELEMGQINNVQIDFKNNATLKTNDVEKQSETKYEMQCMFYSLCNVVNGSNPMWSVSAKSGVYDAEQRYINLYSAWLQVYSVPILWTPLLKFSNLDFHREMGFLLPVYKSSGYGGYIINEFYLPIGDSQDIFLGNFFFLEGHPSLYSFKYNGYAFAGDFNINASFVPNNTNFVNNKEEKEWHFFIDVNQHINDTFKFSSKSEFVSYANYLNLYNINPNSTAESYLHNDIKLEGFYNVNNYSNFLYQQLTTINPSFEEDYYNKNISLEYKYFGDNSKYGRLNFNTIQSIFAFDNFSNSVDRTHVDINYSYSKLTQNFGNYLFKIQNNSNLYYFNDQNLTITNRYNSINDDIEKYDYNSSIGASFNWEYPVVLGVNDNLFTTLSPTLQATAVKNLTSSTNNILFDTVKSHVSSKNIFSINKYGGYDFIDDATSIAYGLNSIFLNSTNQGSTIFIGQILNLTRSKESTIIPYNLKDSSNYFISLDIYPLNGLDVSADMIIDKDFKVVEGLSSLKLYNDIASLSFNYSYYSNLDTTIYNTDNISEFGATATINISKRFSSVSDILYDATGSNLGLKEINASILWNNECLGVELYTKRNFYVDLSSTSSYGFKIKIPMAGDFGFDL